MQNIFQHKLLIGLISLIITSNALSMEEKSTHEKIEELEKKFNACDDACKVRYSFWAKRKNDEAVLCIKKCLITYEVELKHLLKQNAKNAKE